MLKPHHPIYDQANEQGSGAGGDAAKSGSSSEEVNRLIEKARAEEKAKLYEELNSVRATSEKLSSQAQEIAKKLEETQKQAEKLAMENAALVKATEKEGNVNVKALIQEVTERQAQELTKVTGEQLKSVKDELDRIRSENQALKIGQYRAKKIADAGGKIIASLVRGTTEAEIDQSVAVAMQEYQAIEASIKNTVGNPAAGSSQSQNQGSGSAAPILPSAADANGGSPSGLETPNLSRSKNVASYASEREKKLELLKQRYG